MGEKVTKTLTPKKMKAIEALLKTGSITEAAKVAKVTRKTVYKWLKEDDFSMAFEQAAADSMRLLALHMSEGARKAAAALEKVIEDPDASRKEIISAARGYLSATPVIKLVGKIEGDIESLKNANNS